MLLLLRQAGSENNFPIGARARGHAKGVVGDHVGPEACGRWARRAARGPRRPSKVQPHGGYSDGLSPSYLRCLALITWGATKYRCRPGGKGGVKSARPGRARAQYYNPGRARARLQNFARAQPEALSLPGPRPGPGRPGPKFTSVRTTMKRRKGVKCLYGACITNSM